MKYKTVIEIVTDASDKDEAVEIVGDYLSGNLASGVSMKCRTAPARRYNRCVVSVVAVLLLIAAGTIPALYSRQASNSAPSFIGSGAVQPPLKTAVDNKNQTEFKKDWQNRQTKTALNFIKKR